MKLTPLLWFHFGPFRLCPAERVLLREGERVDLTPRTFDALAFLVKSAPNLVTSEELIASVWKTSQVEPASVAQQIYYARKALNDTSQDRKYGYIENVAGSGYRFVAKVEERWEPYTNGTQEVTEGATIAPTPDQTAGTRVGIKSRWWIAGLSGTLAVGSLVIAARPFAPLDVRILKYTQLTDDGRQKTGPLLTDGRQLIFCESEGLDRIMTIPVSGGPAVPLASVASGAMPADLSADGKSLLFIKPSVNGSQLWIHSLVDGSSRLLMESSEGGWAPDGNTLALGGEGTLSVGRAGEAFKAVAVHGRAWNPRWSPDGRKIRFGLEEPDSTSLWEIAADGSGLHRIAELANVSKITNNGVWSRDGQYFFFEAGTDVADNIWVSREGGVMSSLRGNKPVPFTNGPGSWKWPLVGKDSRLFAIHQIAKPQLVFLDAASQTWRPFWQGYAAYEMDFSRDGQSVTYVRYPEHTLWRAKADGSEKFQLTHREFEVHQPHWSPDGKSIAFMGRKKDGPWLVFVVSPGGGAPEALLPSGADQGVPTWSPDGRSVIFGDRLYVKSGQYMNVHSLDLANRRLTDVPNSHGMWSPRWSPDGKHIVALSSDSEVLYTLAWPGAEWKQSARLYFIDNATWSTDSGFIYFNGRTVAGHPMELFRLEITPGAVPEKLADLKDFAWAPENWFGITPAGVPLALRDASAEEIFAIDYAIH